MSIICRPRRNRKSEAIRDLVQETRLSLSDIIAPFFIIDGEKRAEPIDAMPGICRYTPDNLLEKLYPLHKKGLRGVALFPHLAKELRTDNAREAFNPDGLIPKTLRLLKKELPELCLIADVALDPYTLNGHDGLTSPDGEILNDETVEVLCHQALTLSDAGADIVAPSDMMDGRVRAIRLALDAANFTHVNILSYAAKYASSFYSPFRDATGTSLAFGDKKTYQMNPANVREALLEAALDETEGADMLMVKPATLYLDVIAKLREKTYLPIAAYHVSGEYAMVMAAAKENLLDPKKAFWESLIAIKRAGADFILTYALDYL